MGVDMLVWLDYITYWHWLIIAAVLIALEISVPGYIFLWLATAAGITGLFKLVLPLSGELQLIVFGILSIVTVVYANMFIKKHATETDQPTLNRRGQQYIGKQYILEEAIENGAGRLKIGGSIWRIEGDNLPAGSKVNVVSINGASFVVELVDA